MDAVMLVEVLDVHGHVQIRQRITGVGSQCRIGRSLRCEVTIDDPFAAPEHARLTLQPDGRVLVQDLASRNGTRLDGERIDSEAGRLFVNGELLLGRTRVRVRSADEIVPPERLFRRDLLRRHRTLLAAGGLLLCFACAAFLQWLAAPDQLGQRLLIVELILFTGLALWVGAWCLISRLTVGAWQVRIHLAIASVAVGLCAWGYWIQSLIAFALQWSWLGSLMVVLALCIGLGGAWLHLRNATHFRVLPSLLLAGVATLIGGGIWWVVELQLDPRTVNRMQQGAPVFPPAVRFAPSMDPGDYLSDVAALKREANANRQESLLDSPILDVQE